MASDPSKPLLRLIPREPRSRPIGKPKFPPRPQAFSEARQLEKFAPRFDRLANILGRDSAGLELRADPTALAPERLLVFEVRGLISAFASAARNVPGLEFIDEEELDTDSDDKNPVAYLMLPDARALKELESLWKRWRRGQLARGETAWREVFQLLRDLRPWGPADRVRPLDAGILAEEIEGLSDHELVTLEIELIFREDDRIATEREQDVRAAILMHGGRIASCARIGDIAYHALLAELPVRAIRPIIQHSAESIAALEAVMHIRPQSIATAIELMDATAPVTEPASPDLSEPVLALLDGVPVAGHAFLRNHAVVDDQFGLEAAAAVSERVHGTAMASLIIHGDLNRPQAVLPRQVHVVPVLGMGDRFPSNRLIIDIIYNAILAMRDGPDPTAPGVLIVNLSLGNSRCPFHGQMSPWARLLDRLAFRFGILFLVSAGNNTGSFAVPAFPTRTAFEDPTADRPAGILRALGNIVADRRLFAPAETVNGITVGACNEDSVGPTDRATARVNIDPYPNVRIANPSSALGPGFAASVKPDILMPGAREHLRVIRSNTSIEVAPAGPMRSAGLRVAAPPRAGFESAFAFTNGTSAATALASRTCHRIHDALESAYGDAFLGLTHLQRAVILKALLVHPAKWPEEAAELIRATIGPANPKQHALQKDNIRRFLGYGIVDGDDAVACAADRATFWATGTILRDRIVTVPVPIPSAIGGQSRPHALSATLAWFTPISPGRKRYRSVRLKLLEPEEIGMLGVKAHSNQPDGNQTNRGTLFTRCWSGDKAPVVSTDMNVEFVVQRDPDQGADIDEAVPFGLAITVTMPGVVEIYEQVRQRLAITPRQP